MFKVEGKISNDSNVISFASNHIYRMMMHKITEQKQCLPSQQMVKLQQNIWHLNVLKQTLTILTSKSSLNLGKTK